MQKMLLRILSLVLLVSFMVSPVVAQSQGDDPVLQGIDPSEITEVKPSADLQKVDRYIVLFEGDSLVRYQGGVPGLRAPGPVSGEDGIDVTSPESVQYLNFLNEKQNSVLDVVEARLGRKLDVEFRYDVILNGIAAEMSAAEAQKIAKLDGIRSVSIDQVWQLNTDVSPEFIGANTLWEETPSTPGNMSTKGEGMLVGILDTGINLDHPSFADIGDDGYDHTNPLGAGNYLGLCDSDPTNFVCNDKLIGVYAYTQADEALFGEDAHAHGSHTASTAAGNYLETEFNGIPVTISGMAPHANIIAYDVCHAGGCPNSYSAAAVQQAVIDGVDVLNYSIGPSSGAVNPYENDVELAMLEAIDAGILTVTSGGNEGPDPSTVYKAPAWNLIVANSTHGRIFGYPVNVFEPGGPASLYEAVALPGVGEDFSVDVVNQSIRWAGDDVPANFEGCDAFTADFFDGAIALISRGACAFADKINNAAAAGAVGVLVYNNSAGPPIVMGGIEGTTIPSAMLDKEDGDAIVALMSGSLLTTIGSDQVAGTKAIWADILASGSSRGPFELMDILVPEVAAPGTNILAAYNTPGATAPFGGVGSDIEIDLMSGTSMASPHGAGSALLLMDLFPDWTPMEIKSAIMMSANDTTMVKEDGITPTDPFDDGNGRIDLTKAALIGLVMDETVANFTDADPAAGGDVKTLNIPSYQNSQCVGECSFNRTVKNVADVATDYTVVVDAPVGVSILATPSTFTLDPGATQAVTFEVDVSGAEIGAWQFGFVTFDTDDSFLSGEPITDARIPFAIMPDAGNLPSLIEEEVYRDAGGVVLEDLYSIEITDMTFETAGLTEADLYDFAIAGDPTNGDAFDDLGDIWYTTFNVPANTKRVVMEILETTASDLDLFFGEGNAPSAESTLASSATPAALEYINVPDPEAKKYWVLVQNWGGGVELDDVILALGVVPDAESTNFDITGPPSVAAVTEFDLEITWDIPEMEPLSAWYGWFSVGSDPANPGNIGKTDMNIYRPYDDVMKEVSQDPAETGERLTYTITVAPNETGADLDYVIHDVLPDGVSYVPDSLTTVGSPVMATYDGVTNAVHWEATMPKIEYTYFVSDNTTNPSCSTPFGGYVNLQAFGINTIAGIEGDSFAYYTSSSKGTEFYGSPTTQRGIFTDDGYFLMREEGAALDWLNQELPDATPPNGLIAGWWRDMWVTYNAALNKGVSIATFGSGWLIEFDDSEDYYDPNNTMDYEIIAYYDADPSVGSPDIMVAFDNVVGDWNETAGMPWGTVGVENYDGSVGTTYAYDDWHPVDGAIVCFDYAEAGADPVVITFDVMVDSLVEMTEVTNTATHIANGFGMLEEEASASFMGYPQLQPVAEPQSLTTPEETPLDITLTGSNLNPGPVTWEIELEPEYGTLTGTAPNLVYTPDENFYGLDSFTFIVNDGIEDSDPGVIEIEVTNINDGPVANDDYYEVDINSTLNVAAPGVLLNDIELDYTDDVFVDLKEGPAHGDLVLNEDGSFTYTPTAGFFGEDTFTYYMLGIPDRDEYVDEATVYITVHPAVMIYFPIIQQ